MHVENLTRHANVRRSVVFITFKFMSFYFFSHIKTNEFLNDKTKVLYESHVWVFHILTVIL